MADGCRGEEGKRSPHQRTLSFAMFYHSLISDWNHGNAHFLRGVATELMARGHRVRIFEPRSAWSVANLIADTGEDGVRRFHQAYPHLTSHRYEEDFDLESALSGIDVIIVHEWNEPYLVRRVGEVGRRLGCRVLFHDTHHRACTQPAAMARYDLSRYDGVLAFGAVLRDKYLRRGWADRVWVWHEAADVRVFYPRRGARSAAPVGDLIWIGNWGDEERTQELQTFLVRPIGTLGLRARAHGVRYPDDARAQLAEAGCEVSGWLANHEVPQAFARFRVTVHIPRRPYVEALVGIPTIRPFEALACGIPLVCSPWDDCEGLFREGTDYLVAQSTSQMCRHLNDILFDPSLATSLSEKGRQTILERHTCGHRVSELLGICRELGLDAHDGAPRFADRAPHTETLRKAVTPPPGQGTAES